MKSDYAIKIYLTPDTTECPDTPYFWCLLVLRDDWCNEGSGWAKTPEQAFQDGYQYYRQKYEK